MELSFLTPTKFSTMIEEMVIEKHVTYMDACLEYCKNNNIEPESLGRLVNKALKQKIQVEAENLNFLKKSS
ncbi:MAG: late promoter transcription accessory protein, partial [Candidatus Pacebacteria bacterium]|nr:late promoter transcription accessory protein [Candidatus Paceibacterota bacterium]